MSGRTEPDTLSIDAAYVAARLEEAAETLKRLPFPKHAIPKQPRAGMPEVVRDYWDLMNSMTTLERDLWVKDNNRVRLVASPDQIERMDRCLEWLYWIKQPRDRKAVWAVALGVSYRRVARYDGRSHETIRGVVKAVHSRLAAGLNACFGEARRALVGQGEKNI